MLICAVNLDADMIQIGSGINSFFSLHYPSVTITSLVTQLISFPAGVLLAKVLPIKTIQIGRYKFCINPDHTFNIKEHTVITIMSNLSFGTSWATDIIVSLHTSHQGTHDDLTVLRSKRRKPSSACRCLWAINYFWDSQCSFSVSASPVYLIVSSSNLPR